MTDMARLLILICVSCGLLSDSPDLNAQDRSNRDWISGNDETLAFHFSGTLVHSDGAPFRDAVVFAAADTRHSDIELPVEVDGDRFRFSLPASESIHSIKLFARDTENRLHAVKRIPQSAIRHFSQNDIELRLNEADRELMFRTECDGVPISGANLLLRFADGLSLQAVSDSEGVATIRCLTGLELLSATAWKDQSFVGGHQFNRLPLRKTDEGVFVVELHSTRSQKIQLFDQDGNPIANVPFTMNVAERGESVNFMFTDLVFECQTDENGEAVVDWFPDIPSSHANFRAQDPAWVDGPLPELRDGVYVATLFRADSTRRIRVTGRVTSAVVDSLAGFHVTARSFQSEIESRIDSVDSFTNPDGTFSLDVIPGATYCYYLNDEKWVSAPEAQILVDQDGNRLIEPEIEIITGHEVRIIATQGPNHRPYPGLLINLDSDISFQWEENGSKQSGSLGRNSYITTDESGVGSRHVSLGALEARVYQPDWRFQTEVEIVDSEPNIIYIHRPFAEAVHVQGVLTSESMNMNAEVVVSAFDGETSGQQTIRSDRNGRFEFETKSSKVAIYAYADDGTLAGFDVFELPLEQVELELKPTTIYRGRLLDADDHPLSEYKLTAQIRVSKGWEPEHVQHRQLTGNLIEITTDQDGYYEFSSIPVGVSFNLSACPSSNPSDITELGRRYVAPEETRPLDVSRIGDSEEITTRTFQSRLDSLVKTCELYDIYTLAIVTNSEASLAFVDRVTSNYDERAILGYLPIILDLQNVDERAELTQAMEAYGWQTPDAENALFVILGHQGEELARLMVDTTTIDCREVTSQWIATHEPPAKNAADAFEAALEEAGQTGRVVWAQHSQTRCGPCFRLSRWIDENRELLERDFVFVRIDDVRDENGIEIAQRITDGAHHGIPFVAIFDADGSRLSDSEGPFGNIGFPSSFEGSYHLRKMIESSASRISETELDQLIDTLNRN